MSDANKSEMSDRGFLFLTVGIGSMVLWLRYKVQILTFIVNWRIVIALVITAVTLGVILRIRKMIRAKSHDRNLEHEIVTPFENEDAVFAGHSKSGKNVYVKQQFRKMHTQVVGTTNAGKTESVILPWAIDDIKIKLCGESREINPGLFGVTIEGFFRPKQTPIDDEDNLEAWDWLSDLQPKLIRFPGGASGTFMHLLPFQDLEAPFEVLDSIKGYGYDINEIIRYFDGTDLSIETDEPGFVESIHTDMLDEICDDFDL